MALTDEIKLALIGTGILALMAAFAFTYHRGYSNGRNVVIAADAAALVKAQAAAAAQQAKDNALEQQYEKQIASLQSNIAQLTASVGTVQLCESPGSGVSSGSNPAPVAGTPASPGAVQQVPAGNNPVRQGPSPGPDIGNLLIRLSTAADAVSARLSAIQQTRSQP